MEKLPEDVFVKILKLFAPVDRLKLGLVCKTWQNVLKTAWSDVKGLEEIDKNNLIQLLPFCGKYLTHISVIPAPFSTLCSSDLLKIVLFAPKLTFLCVKDMEIGYFDDFLETIEELKNLDSLHLHFKATNCSLAAYNKPKIAIHRHLLPKLNFLEIEIPQTQEQGSQKICWAELIIFLNDVFFPSLAQCPEKLWVTVEEDCRDLCFCSHCLESNRIPLDMGKVCPDSSYTCLKDLSLLGSSLIDDVALRKIMDRAQALERLRFCSFLKCGYFEFDFFCFGFSRNLQILEIAHPFTTNLNHTAGITFGDAHIAVLAANCKQLRVFRVSKVAGITDIGILSLGELSELEEITIQRNYVHDWSLSMIFPRLPKLETFRICSGCHVEGSFLYFAVSYCPKLKEICLNECKNVKNSAIEAISECLAAKKFDRMCESNEDDAQAQQPLTINAGQTAVSLAAIFNSELLQNLPLNLSFNGRLCYDVHNSMNGLCTRLWEVP